jgi:hypothetical protein
MNKQLDVEKLKVNLEKLEKLIRELGNVESAIIRSFPTSNGRIEKQYLELTSDTRHIVNGQIYNKVKKELNKKVIYK